MLHIWEANHDSDAHLHVKSNNAQSFPLKCSSLSLKLIFPDALHCLSVLRWERRKHGRSSAYNQDASQQKLLTVESGQRQKGCVMTAITGKSVGEVHTWISGSELAHQQQMEWKSASFLPCTSCQNTLPALVVLVEGLIVIEECLLYMRIKG